jgi:hypothetical protein
LRPPGALLGQHGSSDGVSEGEARVESEGLVQGLSGADLEGQQALDRVAVGGGRFRRGGQFEAKAVTLTGGP